MAKRVRIDQPASPLAFAAWPSSSNSPVLRGLIIAAVVVFLTAVALPRICFWVLEAQGIETKPLGAQTPAHFGAPYEDLQLQSKGRSLHGRLVQGPATSAPAVLIFHGNGESVSDWARVQAQLRSLGMSSMVFDYSGFGASGGSPSIENLREDAMTAVANWMHLTPHASKRVLLGHSLGNAVMLDAAKSLPQPLPMVIHAGFTSAREIAIETGLLHPVVSKLISPLLPDVWNNEETLSGLNSRVLILHGDRDDVIPPEMASRLAKAAGSRAQMQIHAGVGHDDIFLETSAAEWDSLVQWANSL